MLHIGNQLRRALIFVHRWMGVAFCLLFLLWFSSGMVMMYWDYPMVSAADRLSRAPALQASAIRLSPEEAYSRLGSLFPPSRVRIVTFDGRPAYRFDFDKDEAIVYADNGQQQIAFPPEVTLRIACAWTGQPPQTARVEENTTEDQWTVSGEFQALRPLRKYLWPDGEQVYVSTVTGDVVQYTTRASRIGAYFGAIPHWLYFTPLRKHGERWSQVVIWASGLGTIVAIIGITIGVWTLSPSKRFQVAGAPSSLPYTGPKRWHALLGLIFGLLACTWTFSGMLSMDPFPQWQGEGEDGIGTAVTEALRGGPPALDAFASKLPQEALAEAGASSQTPFQAKELELTSFAGEPAYLASAGLSQTRIVPVRREPREALDRDKIVELVRGAVGPSTLMQVRWVTQYEAYYLDRHARSPLPVLFVQLDDPERSAYYIDPKTATIVQSYNSQSRRNRWLYHGFHSINLPWLYRHRPAWDLVVLTLLLGGTSLCVTSLLLAWQVLRRKFTPRMAPRGPSATASP